METIVIPLTSPADKQFVDQVREHLVNPRGPVRINSAPGVGAAWSLHLLVEGEGYTPVSVCPTMDQREARRAVARATGPIALIEHERSDVDLEDLMTDPKVRQIFQIYVA